MLDPQLQARVTIWRARAAAGDLPESEMIEAVRAIREGRLAAAETAKASKAKASKVAIPLADDLLDELDKL